MGSHDVLAPGSVFAGSFRIVELLADGDMGKTYLVDPLPPGGRCVLKAMVATVAKNDAIRAIFVAQAKATSRVASPHLLQTLDAGIDSTTGRPWFTTDLLRGEDLASRVGRWGPQPLSEVRALVAALGDALGKAHAEGLVHYDLTPENVHLGAGKPSRFTLRELTISRLVSDACAAEGDIVGSPIWMPPEQFELGRALAASANVWSVGLLAFYAATGKTYWVEATDDPAPSRALLREILRDPIAGASERAKALGYTGAMPPGFDAWFARCVTRDAGRRFPDATVASALFADSVGNQRHDAAQDAGDAQRTTTRMPPKPPRVKGSRSLPLGVVADAKGAPAAGSATPPPAATAASAPASASRRGGRRRRTPRVLVVLTAVGVAVAWFWPPHSCEQRRAPSAGSDARQAAAPPATQLAVPPPAPSPSASTEASASGREAIPSSAVAGGGTTDFDLAGALRSLNGIYYGNCPVPAAGKLAVTFAPNGRVQKVTVVRGNYDEEATTCVAARFGAATVAPFRGGAQTVTADLVATR